MMYEYLTIEEIVETMSNEEWFDLMADCYIDEWNEMNGVG